MTGILRVVSNTEMMEAESAERERQEETVTDSLAAHIRKQWETNKRARSGVDEALNQCRRARANEYDPDVKAEINETGGSDIYMPLTQMQCVAAASWLADILLPAGDKPWGLEPTTEPELPEYVVDSIVARVQGEARAAMTQGEEVTEDQYTQRVEQLAAETKQRLDEIAEDAAERMERKVEDQLEESGWHDTIEQFIDDVVTYPAAFIKTVYRRKRSLAWREGRPQVEEKIVQCDERVSPFDIYPSPEQIEVDEGNLIERMRLSRADIYGLIGMPGYREDKLRAVLGEYDGGLREWTDESVDETDLPFRDNDGLINALHYWGSAQGLTLLEWGVDPCCVDDPMREYQIEAILIGRHVIRAAINDDPLNRRPYYKASYRNKPGSFWGVSIPQLCRGHQRMCNAAARALSNNMGIASGPQIVALIDRLPEGETLSNLRPLKIWQMTSDMSGQSAAPPLNFHQPDSNADELMRVMEYFWEQTSEVTGISKAALGVDQRLPQGQQTAQGLAMILENSAKTIKAAVRHIDHGVIRPRIERQYNDNMMYESDNSIKGDIKVVPRGASALVAKAATQARRNEFLAMTNNEVDSQIIGVDGRAELLRQMAKDLDLPDIVPTREELQQSRAQQQEQPQDPSIVKAQIDAQTRLQDQQLEMQDRERDRQLKIMLAELEDKHHREQLQADYQKAVTEAQAKLQDAIIKARAERETQARELAYAVREGHGI